MQRPIADISGRQKSFIPKSLGHARLDEKGSRNVGERLNAAFCGAILLRTFGR
jgi:hypothetical protein